MVTTRTKNPKDLRTHSFAGSTLEFLAKWLLVIAIAPKAMQLLVFGVCAINLAFKAGGALRVKGADWLLLAWLGIYLLSILMHAEGAGTERLLAAANTWLIWAFGLIMYMAVRMDANLNINRMSRYVYINLLILASICLVTWAVSFNVTLPWDGKILWKSDWGNGAVVQRFTGLLGYSNAVVFAFLLLVPLCVPYLRLKESMVRNSIFMLAALFLVVSCGSRAGLAVGFVAGALLWLSFLLQFDYRGKRRILIILLFILVAFIALTFYWPQVSSSLGSLVNGRVDSNATRQSVYQQSISAALSESPVFGMGVKVIEDGSSIPLGSHSTYIGLFYRTGLLGLALIVVAFCMHLQNAWRRPRKKAIDWMWLAGIALFIAFEDIDGLNWVLVAFFFYLDLMSRSSMADTVAEHPLGDDQPSGRLGNKHNLAVARDA